MGVIPKNKRIIDRKYLKYVKTRQCIIRLFEIAKDGERCYGPIDPHHADPVSLGGSDYTAVPLCRKHHEQYQSNTKLRPWFIDMAEVLVRDYKREVGVKRERPPTLKSRKDVLIQAKEKQLKKHLSAARKLENELKQLR